MKVMTIDKQQPQIADIKAAADILKMGGLVAFPTETVYGLGAIYSNKKAVQRLYEVKNRSLGKPFTLGVVDKERACEMFSEIGRAHV